MDLVTAGIDVIDTVAIPVFLSVVPNRPDGIEIVTRLKVPFAGETW